MSNFKHGAYGYIQGDIGGTIEIPNGVDVKITFEKIEGGYRMIVTSAGETQSITLHDADASEAEAARAGAEAAQTAAEAAQAAAEDAQSAAENAQDKAEYAQAAAEGVIPDVQAEGQAQIGAIDAEGQAQIAAVDAEGQLQIAAIGAEGERVLETIPEDYSELSGDVSSLKTEIQDILVYSNDVETATVTNIENTQDFHGHTLEISGFYKPISLVDGVLSAVNSGTSTEASPYIIDKNGWGTKKWICGFKYKLTKLDPNVATPEMIRIHLGSTAYDSDIVWGEWIYFSKVAELDLTRIRFATRNFPSAPAADSFKVEIKDMYLYDGTDISADMCAYIMAQQSSNYQDGAVTYTTGEEGYFPDVSLQTSGKAADSKAVGDAIGAVKLDVTKFGVAGDGTTDDTDAINALLTQPGIFYFPAGTYKISGTISVPANSIICGDGDASIIDMYNCDDLTECTFRGSDKVYPYILIANDNCAIKNIKIVGNNTLQQKRHAGIGVLDADRCVIDDVTIYNINYDATQDLDAAVSGYGICVTRSNCVNVDRCNVVQCGYECIGIVDDCNHCVVRDCYTQDGWRTCIQVHRGSSNTLIENCYGKQTHTKYDSCFTVHGQDEQPVSNLRVENCTFECTQNGAQPLDYCAPMQIMSYAECPVFIGNRVFGGKRAFFINQSSTNAKIIGNDFQCNSDSDYGVTIGSLSSIAVGNCLVNEASTPVNVISNNPVLSGNIGIAE